MRIKNLLIGTVSSCLLALVAQPTLGQLYTEDFDDLNASSRWTANAGIGFDDPIGATESLDTNFDRSPLIGGVDGVTDDTSGFAFDYSIHGIPPAPNSANPASTIGLQLQANLFSNRLGGFSASPNGLNLTGDYSITFDYWGSTIGPFPFGGSSSSMMSTFGLLTAGTTSQSILSADGIFFGTVADAGTPADYRVYSAARTFSHQCAGTGDGSGGCEAAGTIDDIDKQATYHAGTRNGTGQLYLDAIGDPTGALLPVPQSVIDAVELIYPGEGTDGAETMGGPLFNGASGFQWHEMEIKKVGPLVEWSMNGFKLITMDTTDWDDPENEIIPGGGNISFGHSDIVHASPATASAIDLIYTLIDNIEVNAVSANVDDADFNGDGDIDGSDFLAWQQGFPITDLTAQPGDGDADGDLNVTAADLVIWQNQFGTVPPLSGLNAVPEPSSLVALLASAVFSLLFGFRLRTAPAFVQQETR